MKVNPKASKAYRRALFITEYDYLIALMKENPELYQRLYVNVIENEKPQTFSISPGAVTNLNFNENTLSFNATFNGQGDCINIPWEDVISIYLPDFHVPVATPLTHIYESIELSVAFKSFPLDVPEGFSEKFQDEKPEVIEKRSKMKLI